MLLVDILDNLLIVGEDSSMIVSYGVKNAIPKRNKCDRREKGRCR